MVRSLFDLPVVGSLEVLFVECSNYRIERGKAVAMAHYPVALRSIAAYVAKVEIQEQ